MEKLIVNNYGSFDVVLKKGKGSTLYATNGRRYIDFVSGIGVNCLGHNYKPLVKAISAQVKKQIHISNYYFSDTGLDFANKLLSLTGYEGAYLGNSGAEANEAAIKLARKYGQLNGGSNRKPIVTLESSFHGRTLATLTATGQAKFHPECFEPYPSGFKTIKANDFGCLDSAFDDTTAALFIECVQGEGGVNILDKEWVQAAAAAARKVGAIVMVDEVQTGIGRTGTLLASSTFDIDAEVVTLAKGIAGGVPMGVCLFKGKANKVFVAGDHQSTFAGNPLPMYPMERAFLATALVHRPSAVPVQGEPQKRGLPPAMRSKGRGEAKQQRYGPPFHASAKNFPLSDKPPWKFLTKDSRHTLPRCPKDRS
mgnify:CR=1 FL=1